MARMLRVNCAGLWYHITARGNERKAIYGMTATPAHFVELFAPWCECRFTSTVVFNGNICPHNRRMC